MRWMRSLCLLPLVAGLLITAPAAAQEPIEPEPLDSELEQRQIYGYVDHQGAWHFVDSLVLVPAIFRPQARGNAVGVLAPEESGPPKPAISRRVLTQEVTAKPAKERQVDAKRGKTIEKLQERRLVLLESIAILEEGSAPAALVDANPDVALTDERLEEFLTDTETELDQLDATLLRLVTTEPPR
jgi:hypothetical protein